MQINSMKASGISRILRLGAVLTVLLLASTLMVGHIALAADNKVITLRYSSPFMPFEPPNIQAKHVFDLVEKKTGGKVKVKRFMGGALGGPLEQLGLVSSGAVDLIALHADQFPQQLPLHQIINTEQLCKSEQGLANVVALTKEIPETRAVLEAEQKKNNIKILSWHVQGVTGITTRFKATSLDDLKGKKVSVVAGFQRKVFKEMGWIPVNVQIPELYEALSRGVIDAIFMATAAVLPLKWNEVGKTHLYFDEHVVLSQPITFNIKSWNKLPADVQKAFIEASAETAQWCIAADRGLVAKTYDVFKKSGVPLVKIDQAGNDKFWKAFMKHAEQNWLDNAKKMGVEKEAALIQKYWNQMKWGKYRK